MFFSEVGVMIDSTEFSILRQALMTLTFIRGHSWTRKQNVLCSLSCKVLIDLDGI